MTETLKNHDIDIQNNMQDWIKNQIEKTYQETDSGLKDLKDKITNDTIENELTMGHVKGVLRNALNKFSQGKSFKKVYGGTTIAGPEGMGAGLVVNVQIALKKLGKDVGVIDGRYGPKTKAAVVAFQKENSLDSDGRAGKNTITKILEKLGEVIIQEPEVIIQEPEIIIQEPEVIIQEPEVIIQEPEAIIQEPEAIIQEPEVTPETNIDHLSKIQENFTLEPVGNIKEKSVEQKDQTFVMKAKVYDKDVSIVFDKDYKNPVLEIGKNIFNLNIISAETGKQQLLITTKQTPQQTQEAEKAVENLYKNAEFVFDEYIHPGIKELFNKNKITNFSLGLRDDITNKENRVEINGVDTEKINLKEDLNPSNNNSIDLDFLKIKGDNVNFKINIVKSDIPNGKRFTLKRVNVTPGSLGETLNETANIRKNISALTLPEGWSKPTNPVVLDTKTPYEYHLKVQNNNKEYQIDFDKDGNLLPSQELSFDGKIYLVSIDGNKLLFTEKNVPQNINNQAYFQELITSTIIFNKPKDKEIFGEIVDKLPENINNDLSKFLSEMKEKGFTIAGGSIGPTLSDATIYSGLILESPIGIMPAEYRSIKSEHQELFTGRSSLDHINIKSVITNNMVKNIMIKING